MVEEGAGNTMSDADIAAAIVAFEQILRVLPDDPTALESLSVVYDRKGDRPASREYLLRASEACLAKRDGTCAGRLVERLGEYGDEDAQCRRMLARMAELVATFAQDKAVPDPETSTEDADSGAPGGSAPEEPPEPHLSAPVIRTANMIIVEAVRRNASYVHLEPGDRTCSVCLMIDGTQHELPGVPTTLAAEVVDFYRYEAGLDFEEKGSCQRGHFGFTALGRECDIALQTMPTEHGLSIDLEFAAIRAAPLNYDVGPCIRD